MNQPPKLATASLAAAQPYTEGQPQVTMLVAPKPLFVPPTLTKHGSVATLTQDFGGSGNPN